MKKRLFLGIFFAFLANSCDAETKDSREKLKNHIIWNATKTIGYGIGAYYLPVTTWHFSESFHKRGVEKVTGRLFRSYYELSKFMEYISTTPIEQQLLKKVNKAIVYRSPVIIGGFMLGVGAAGYCAWKALDSGLDFISEIKKL